MKKMLAELNPDGSLKSRFVYLTQSHSPDYMTYNGQDHFFIKDHVGSIIAVVNTATSTTVQSLSYTEFGVVVTNTNPGFQLFGFAGGHYDHMTGLVRFGARDYDASIGRWTAKDPIRFDGGDTNLYGYVMNDPINFIDPGGETAVRVRGPYPYPRDQLPKDLRDVQDDIEKYQDPPTCPIKEPTGGRHPSPQEKGLPPKGPKVITT